MLSSLDDTIQWRVLSAMASLSTVPDMRAVDDAWQELESILRAIEAAERSPKQAETA